MHRFFVPPECIGGESVSMPDDVSRQLSRVLRSRPGDEIIVLDNSGWEYLITLETVARDGVRGVLKEKRQSTGEPHVRVTLYQGTLKADRFEYVLQKGTELGISRFVPTSCERSVPREQSNARHDRWRRIVTEAAEQSRRGKIPVLESAVDFQTACEGVEGFALIPWEQEVSTSLRTPLKGWKEGGGDTSSASIFIGPEGGFTEEEATYARDRGIIPVSLGKRILRAETAGIVAASAILYELGELGG